jgi:hypothetical protein
MIPAEVPLVLYRNDSWKASGIIYDNQPTPQVVNIQNADILVQIRRRPGGSVIYSIENGNGVTINPNNSWAINAVVTVERGGSYYWDFQVTQPNGEVDTYYAGPCKIIDDISRAI